MPPRFEENLIFVRIVSSMPVPRISMIVGQPHTRLLSRSFAVLTTPITVSHILRTS